MKNEHEISSKFKKTGVLFNHEVFELLCSFANRVLARKSKRALELNKEATKLIAAGFEYFFTHKETMIFRRPKYED